MQDSSNDVSHAIHAMGPWSQRPGHVSQRVERISDLQACHRAGWTLVECHDARHDGVYANKDGTTEYHRLSAKWNGNETYRIFSEWVDAHMEGEQG